MQSRREPNRTTSSPSPDFGARAARYDELRPVDENWWELFDTLVRAGGLHGRRVLEIGCGTGALAVALSEQARVWAIDTSPEMLAVARDRAGSERVGWRVADATALPFRDGWFERVVARVVLHLLDRPRALAEAHRVLALTGGSRSRPSTRRISIGTGSTSSSRRWSESTARAFRLRACSSPSCERRALRAWSSRG